MTVQFLKEHLTWLLLLLVANGMDGAAGMMILYVDITTPNTEDIEQSKNAKYTATFTLDSVNYTVDGVTLQTDVAPYAKDGRIMVPVRYVHKA